MTNYQILVVCAVPLLQAAALYFCAMAYLRGRCWAYLLFGCVHLFGFVVSAKGSFEAFETNSRPLHGQPMKIGESKEALYVTTPPKFPVGSLASAVGFWALATREARLKVRSKDACELPP